MRNSRPYVQLDPAVIEQARQMDLLSYLRAYEPNNLVRVGGSVYCTREHDSLKISNASGIGGREVSAAFLPLTILSRSRITDLSKPSKR